MDYTALLIILSPMAFMAVGFAFANHLERA